MLKIVRGGQTPQATQFVESFGYNFECTRLSLESPWKQFRITLIKKYSFYFCQIEWKILWTLFAINFTNLAFYFTTEDRDFWASFGHQTNRWRVKSIGFPGSVHTSLPLLAWIELIKPEFAWPKTIQIKGIRAALRTMVAAAMSLLTVGSSAALELILSISASSTRTHNSSNGLVMLQDLLSVCKVNTIARPLAKPSPLLDTAFGVLVGLSWARTLLMHVINTTLAKDFSVVLRQMRPEQRAFRFIKTWNLFTNVLPSGVLLHFPSAILWSAKRQWCCISSYLGVITEANDITAINCHKRELKRLLVPHSLCFLSLPGLS